MISSVWVKFVQNMVRVVEYIHKEVVVHVSNQLTWRGIVHSVQAKSDSSWTNESEKKYFAEIGV